MTRLYRTHKKILLAFVLASLLLTILPAVWTAQGNGTVVRVEPEKVTMGPEPALGQQFTIDVILEDVEDFYGWEVKLLWNNTLLNCTAEEYPILPEGLNWEDPNHLKFGPGIANDYNETHGRWYRGLSAVPMVEPYPVSFSGATTLATLTFEVIYHPPQNSSCVLDLFDTKFSTTVCVPVVHDVVDGYYEILSPPVSPLEPRLEIEPESVSTFVGNVFDVDVTISNVEATAMLVGVEFKLRYNTTVLSVVTVTEGPFMKDPKWALNGTELVGPFIEEDYVVLGILLIPHVDGEWTAFPEGNGTLATVTFNATAKGTSALELSDTKLSDSQAESINHTTIDGFVTVTEVTISTDVNGDGIVNGQDIILAGKALASYRGHPRWNPAADINGDDVVDIFDLVLIANDWGKTV